MMNQNTLSNSYPEVELILSESLKSVDPYLAVVNQVELNGHWLIIADEMIDLAQYQQVYLIGFGKAVLPMAKGISSVLSSYVKEGFLITKYFNESHIKALPPSFTVCRGNHPVPGEDTFRSTKRLLDFLSKISEDDLVLCLISGGGSALCSMPVEGVRPDVIKEMTRVMLACGAEINEINALRKHVDRIKGGGLASLIHSARLITLILSDVIGSPLDVIASGPTVPDKSNFADLQRIIEKYNLAEKLPQQIIELVRKGNAGNVPDTPKSGSSCFSSVSNVLIGSNLTACQSAMRAAQKAGFNSMLLTTYLRGEAREAGRFLAGIIAEIVATGNPIQRPACIILGGETTVTIHGDGLGGRNQEMALGAVRDLAGLQKVLLVTLGTDGEDGPTDAAGAWVTGDTLAKSVQSGMNPDQYLDNNDAYHYFEALGQLIQIGPTGTNVNDIAFLFVF